MSKGYEWPEDREFDRRARQDEERRQRTMGVNEMDAAELTRVSYPALMDDLERWRQCSACHREFRELDNLGRWLCRYHPGTVDADGVWDCCGRTVHPHQYTSERWVPRGCHRCDHADAESMGGVEFSGDEVATLPLLLRGAVVPHLGAPEAMVGEQRDDPDWRRHTMQVRRAEPPRELDNFEKSRVQLYEPNIHVGPAE